jgi:hypothetical protein
MVFGLKKMDRTRTDADGGGMGRGSVHALLSPDYKAHKSLDELTDGEDLLELALKGATTERLKAALATQLELLNINGVLRASSELTARGIAPCFYGINLDDRWLKVHWSGVEPILMLVDLHWIVTTYPDHVPEWKRAEQIFDPRRFKAAAEYLHWGGQRTSGQIAKALALTEQQQLECVWIQCLHIQRWRARLLRRLPIAKARITSDVRDKDKRQVKEQDVTILHRCDLWLCAELAKWKPQLTANLYAMLSGQTMSRQAVANQLAKLPRVRRTDEVIA